MKGGRKRDNAILTELSSSSVVAVLGGHPIYVHNNKRYAEAGLNTALTIVQKALRRGAKQTRRRLYDTYIKALDVRERNFYKQSGIGNFNNMRIIWNTFLNIDGSQNEFANYIETLTSFKDMVAYISKAKAAERGNPKLVNGFKDIVAKITPMLQKTSSPIASETILDWLKTGVKYTANGRIIFPKAQKANLQKVHRIIGNLSEDAIVTALNEGFNNNKILDAILEKTGIDLFSSNKQATIIASNRPGGSVFGQGSSDISLTIGQAEVGISIKSGKSPVQGTRKLIANLTDTTTSNAGKTANADNFRAYFNGSAESSFMLTNLELKALYYGISNLKASEYIGPLAHSVEFENQVKYLLAWGKIIKAVLGVGFKQSIRSATTQLPVFIGLGNGLARTRSILQKIANLSDNEIMQHVHQYTSFMGLFSAKDSINQTDLDQLYQEKKNYLSRNNSKRKDNSNGTTYKMIKNDPAVLQTLSDLNLISRCKISVSYNILLHNLISVI